MFSTDDLKKTFSHFATGVTIISSKSESAYSGFTANSFSSVSLDPPLVLFCLNHYSRNVENFNYYKKFAINILSENQQSLALHFASKLPEKFKGIDFKLGNYSNLPLINDALAHIECDITNVHQAGDHYIYVGEVKAISCNQAYNPLIYYKRKFSTLEEEDDD